MTKTIIGIAVLVVVGIFFWQLAERVPSTPTASNEREYESAEFGLSFSYLEGFEIVRQEDSLVFLSQEYVAPEGGEGPPTIIISKYPNTEGLTLEQWVRTDARSNFELSSSGLLEHSTLDDQPSVEYQHSGLYEHDAVAVAHNGHIYVFSVGWMTPQDRLRAVFQDLMSTVKFTN